MRPNVLPARNTHVKQKILLVSFFSFLFFPRRLFLRLVARRTFLCRPARTEHRAQVYKYIREQIITLGRSLRIRNRPNTVFELGTILYTYYFGFFFAIALRYAQRSRTMHIMTA
jgi:hypothetical protein